MGVKIRCCNIWLRGYKNAWLWRRWHCDNDIWRYLAHNSALLKINLRQLHLRSQLQFKTNLLFFLAQKIPVTTISVWIGASVSTHTRRRKELLTCYAWAHLGLESAKKRDEIVENEGKGWMRRERTKKWKILDGKFKFYFCITFSPHVTKIQSRDRIPPYHIFSFSCKSLTRFLQ